jgi:hypothetical protein
MPPVPAAVKSGGGDDGQNAILGRKACYAQAAAAG